MGLSRNWGGTKCQLSDFRNRGREVEESQGPKLGSRKGKDDQRRRHTALGKDGIPLCARNHHDSHCLYI